VPTYLKPFGVDTPLHVPAFKVAALAKLEVNNKTAASIRVFFMTI
jgi:hypothetical protein